MNIDVTVITKGCGWFGDNSRMYMIGDCRFIANACVMAAYERCGTASCASNRSARLGDIGHTVGRC
jgi:methionyl aminopeptidase